MRSTRPLAAVAAATFATFATFALTGAPAVSAGAGTIQVPSDFNPSLSDTRSGGHYAVEGTSLHVWTDSNTGQDKVAEYVDTTTPLAQVGEPALEVTAHDASTIPPGFQLVVDFDGDGAADGILVGEPAFYGNDWWLSNGSAQFVKDAAPSHTGGSGSANHGTLDQWRGAFPDADVQAFGFSLGSGVKGDWDVDAIDFAGTRYTFAADVELATKDECKQGGWQSSTMPAFRNQGDCVSHFASGK